MVIALDSNHATTLVFHPRNVSKHAAGMRERERERETERQREQILIKNSGSKIPVPIFRIFTAIDFALTEVLRAVDTQFKIIRTTRRKFDGNFNLFHYQNHFTVRHGSIRTDRSEQQCRPRSDCSKRNSLIRAYTVCYATHIFGTHY